jgi:hypothetical protein
MLTDRRRTVPTLVAATGVLFALLVGSCSSSGDSSATTSSAPTGASGELSEHVALSGVPGVTDTEIRFAAVGTGAGNPLGTCILSCFTDGVQAYFDYRNSQGGIWGRGLVLSETLDDGLANNQAKSLEIISNGDTFATFSAPLVPAGWTDLADAGIPIYTLAIHPVEGQPQIFGNAPAHCYDCTSRPAAYLAQQAGAQKVAVLGYGVSENSKLCAESYRSTIEKYSDDIGGATVGYFNDTLAFGLTNGIGPEVTAMKDAGVDFVLSCLDLNGMSTLAQELQRQGIRDQVTLVHPNSYDQDFIASSGDLFEGDYVTVGFRPFEADSTGNQLAAFEEWMGKSGKPLSEHAMIGWVNADLAFQGLAAAGPEFSRQKVIDRSNETLTAFTAGGLVPPIDWSRQHEPPTEADPATHGSDPECGAAVVVRNGTFEVLGDPAKPWACWPGTTRDWSEPVATNFS